MPKNKKKQGRSNKGRENGHVDGSDDESLYNDAASVISDTSVGSRYRDEGNFDSDAGKENDILSENLYEDKIKEDLEMAMQKSGEGRTAALKRLGSALAKKHLPEVIDGSKATLADICDKSLKKGKPKEQIAASDLAVLLAVQVGDIDGVAAEDIYKELKPILVTKLLDGSTPLAARTAAATALGNMCFLTGTDLNEWPELMDTLEKVFRSSYNAEAAVKFNEETLSLHTACVNSWSLLSTLLPAFKCLKLLETKINDLACLLESPDVDVRIAAGEAVAVLYEAAVDADEEEAENLVDMLIPQLKQLSTDSHKYRSKKDRKEQKSSFRDILKFIEDFEPYEEKVNFNSRESLVLDGWGMKRQYDAICKALSSGVNLHLTENELIRNVFQLGSPIPTSVAQDSTNKLSKHQRNSINQAAFKARSQARGKHRDKRSAVVV